MVAWRNNLRRMRRDVHQHMRVPALYLPRRDMDPIRCDVRPHVRFQEAGVSGAGVASVADVIPRIKFDRTQVSRPGNAGFVVMSEAEAYKIGRARPPEDGWVVAEVSQMSEADASALWQSDWADLLG